MLKQPAFEKEAAITKPRSQKTLERRSISKVDEINDVKAAEKENIW